jgi:p-hydroxybenzoate 3-monooxygenase
MVRWVIEGRGMTRTQVAIIGAGPAGLLLSQLLHRAGIEAVVLERRDRAYVEGRIRAGVLEQGTVDLLREAGAAERLDREGLMHRGIEIAVEGHRRPIDFEALIGRHVVVYGQTEVTKDLIKARLACGAPLVFEAEDAAVHDIAGDRPRVTWRKDGTDHRLACDFIAGCDGFHGVCRASLPAGALAVYEQAYPFAWLGILAEAPPAAEDLIYARHSRGFALFSMRSRHVSRNYLQCRPDEDLAQWPDARIWDELAARLGPAGEATVHAGPVIEKSITPMRSFVAEPLRHGRLFLAGDAGHIVPPTGAKGLNLAASDVHYLSEALIDFYRSGRSDGLDAYSGRALARVWKAQRFSWWMTMMLHRLDGGGAFESRVRAAELDYVLTSPAAMTALAENYTGLPF